MDPIGLLTGAVEIASPSGSERLVAEYLVGAMQSCCDASYVDAAGNAIGHWGTGPVRLWLLGHIDTVPGHIEVRVVDGELYGRGAVDAKGSFCAFVAAVAGLPATLADDLSIILIGAVGEEAPGSSGARHAVASLEPPDLTVIGEPSGWDGLTLGYKGTLQAEIAAVEPGRHTSVDEPTAAEKVVEAYNAIRLFVDQANTVRGKTARFERLQLRLLEIAANDDGLRQQARARLGFRLPPLASPEGLAVELRRLAHDAGVHYEAVPGAVPAYRADKGGALPAAFRTAIRAAGGTARHKLKMGTTDMNVVASAWQAAGVLVPPMIAYGPGDASLDHTPDERLALAEYGAAITVLREALATLAA